MADGFELDERIAASTWPVGQSGLCLVRLMNDRRYPWLVLVPRTPGLVEIFDLTPDDRHRLIDLAADLAQRMTTAFGADKINVGALGNRVRQFHLHVVARRATDPSWPDAVWDGSPGEPYEPAERDAVLRKLEGWFPHGS